jgi:DNA-directed RNA polymerase specialized sigma subunit
MATNYVDNTKFLNLLNEYIEEREKRKQQGLPPPKISNEIGKIFIDIAKNLSLRYNFNGYTFRDEMIGDGILNAVEAIDSFDPQKSNNPFAYFTQIIYWAFVRRIEKEKKERDVRDNMMFDVEIETYTTIEGEKFNLNQDNLYLWYYNQNKERLE